ncbi:MAG TPA: hypothetical protein V6D11_22145 [Waterburya sp.]|jgi:hypothetical protein
MRLGVGTVKYDIVQFITQYLQSRGLLRQDFSTTQGRIKIEYQKEYQFWQDVMGSGKIYETCRVRLNNFLLCSWIPRASGQYYTSEARNYRRQSKHFVRERGKGFVVFDPYGKSSMVKGGIGCLRLTQKQVGNESLHFLCATSSGVAHRGLLVGLRRNLYEKLVEDIERYGGVSCSIVGQIRYWSCEDMLPTYTPRHLPRMYLYAERLDNVQKVTESGKFKVTAAVLFRGNVEGYKDTFFVYSNFEPGKRGNLDDTIEQCVDWMEKNYVTGMYRGKVLTDFDEVVPRFDNVSFPIKALMNPDADASSVSKMCSKLYRNQSFIDGDLEKYIVNQVIIQQSESTTIKISEIGTMNNKEGDTYNVGQAGAVGRHARSDYNTFYHSEQKQTLAEAAAEIQKLLKQLEQTNPTATEAEKVAFVNDETSPSFKRRVVGALKALGEAAIDEFVLENKSLKVIKETVKGWMKPE